MSPANESGDPRQTMPERYGAPRVPSRRLIVGLVAALAALGLAWLGWAAWSQARPDVRAAVRSFDVSSTHEVEVLVDVHRDSRAGVRCAVSALADDHSTVGEDELVVPAGAERDLRVAITLRTSRRATTAIVDNCRSA